MGKKKALFLSAASVLQSIVPHATIRARPFSGESASAGWSIVDVPSRLDWADPMGDHAIIHRASGVGSSMERPATVVFERLARRVGSGPAYARLCRRGAAFSRGLPAQYHLRCVGISWCLDHWGVGAGGLIRLPLRAPTNLRAAGISRPIRYWCFNSSGLHALIDRRADARRVWQDGSRYSLSGFAVRAFQEPEQQSDERGNRVGLVSGHHANRVPPEVVLLVYARFLAEIAGRQARGPTATFTHTYGAPSPPVVKRDRNEHGPAGHRETSEQLTPQPSCLAGPCSHTDLSFFGSRIKNSSCRPRGRLCVRGRGAPRWREVLLYLSSRSGRPVGGGGRRVGI